MTKFALLVLRNGGNRVIDEVHAHNKTEAIDHFNDTVELTMLSGETQQLTLDSEGYFKDGEITYTIAEFFENGLNNH